MACPVCGANCKCRKRGSGGECCGCHKHKATRYMTTEQLLEWRARHEQSAREREAQPRGEPAA